MKSRQQIAYEYGISERTLMRRLKILGVELPLGLITPKWQIIIYATLGEPVFK